VITILISKWWHLSNCWKRK